MKQGRPQAPTVQTTPAWHPGGRKVNVDLAVLE